MSNKLFPKVTEIEGGAANVVSPEFSLTENSAIVFLIGASETPLTVKVKAGKEAADTDIAFKTKALAGVGWTEVSADGLALEETEAFLVAVPAEFLAHDEFDRAALNVDAGSGATPKAIYAFEIVTRYIPE